MSGPSDDERRYLPRLALVLWSEIALRNRRRSFGGLHGDTGFCQTFARRTAISSNTALPWRGASSWQDRAEDLFIGGVVDATDGAIVLYRGNLDRLVVPLEWFKPRPKSHPDFEDFTVIDGGQTVRLGGYEASADAILYEFDAEARRRMKDRRIEQDASFGGALRRLRLARGLTRSDFAPLAEKTIARIERGEVEAPHGDTLAILARRLKVKANAIASY